MRVVLWHGFGSPVLSYVIAAVPAMFFVTGDLLAASARRRPVLEIVMDRLRRLLVPFWAFAVVAWCVMMIGGGRIAPPVSGWRSLAWILPLVDPPGSAWDGGWLASALWYLRAYLWLLLLAPLLLACSRRWPRALVAGGVAATIVVDVATRSGWLSPSWGPTLGWKLGDLALYGTFLTAGMAHSSGVLRDVPPRRWLVVAAAAVAAAVLWRVTQAVPRGVVNNSQPLHLLVGAAWLAVALAARGPLIRLAHLPSMGPVLAFLGRRSLTIYLWHPACILLALRLLDRHPFASRGLEDLVYIALVLSGLVVAIAAAGWVEDVAAGRPTRLHPFGRGRCSGSLITASVSIAVIVGFAATPIITAPPSPSATRRIAPPLPSQQPPPLRFAGARPTPTSDLAASVVLERWRRANGAVGVAAGVLSGDGQMWTGASGSWLDGRAVRPDDTFDIQSTTKLFTAWLVYLAAQDGLIGLDSPLPDLPSVRAEKLPSTLTPRLLLAHRSGLVNYRDTSRYQQDLMSIVTPSDAIAASLAEPVLEAPDAVSRYSSVNYLLLGELLEHVRGQPFNDLLTDGLGQIGTRRATHTPPRPGEPNHATAGIVADVDDLLLAGHSILRGRLGLSEESAAAMASFDLSSGIGAGSLAVCPCELDDLGRPQVFGFGHTGGATMLEYLPSVDRVVVIHLAESLYEGDRFTETTKLLTELAVARPV